MELHLAGTVRRMVGMVGVAGVMNTKQSQCQSRQRPGGPASLLRR
jgi:hypothetical protein